MNSIGKIRSHGGHYNKCTANYGSSQKKITFTQTRNKFRQTAFFWRKCPFWPIKNEVSNLNSPSIGYRLEIKLENEKWNYRKRIVMMTQNSKNIKLTLIFFFVCLSELLAEHESELIKQIVGYIGGFVVRHLLKHIKCEYCKDCLLANNRTKTDVL